MTNSCQVSFCKNHHGSAGLLSLEGTVKQPVKKAIERIMNHKRDYHLDGNENPYKARNPRRHLHCQHQ